MLIPRHSMKSPRCMDCEIWNVMLPKQSGSDYVSRLFEQARQANSKADSLACPLNLNGIKDLGGLNFLGVRLRPFELDIIVLNSISN